MEIFYGIILCPAFWPKEFLTVRKVELCFGHKEKNKACFGRGRFSVGPVGKRWAGH